MASEGNPTSTRPRRKGLLTNASWNGAYVVLTMALSFVTTPLLLEHLGQSTYGVLVLIWSVAGILGSMDLGLGESTLRYVARYLGKDDMVGVNRVFTAVLTFFSLVCVALVAGLFAGAPAVAAWLNAPAESFDTVVWLLRIAAVTIALSILTKVYSAIPQAMHRFDVSNKVFMTSSTLRSSGYIALALSGFDIAAIVVWDLLVSIATFGVTTIAARHMLPALRAFPYPSLTGLREVLGYSVFSFLTFFLHKWHLESGKLIIARILGPAPVVFLSAPDNIAQRFREVLTGGVESTFPRFSEQSDDRAAGQLLWRATWASLALSTVVFVPFIVIVPDFLRLWVDAEFAEQAGGVGRVLGLHLVLQSTFAAHAVFFRGTGRPWVVTAVTLAALVVTVSLAVVLVPIHGAIGAAYAFLAGSTAPFVAVIVGSLRVFGSSAVRRLLETVALPMLCAALAGVVCWPATAVFGTESWLQLVVTAGLLTAICGSLVFGVELLVRRSESVALEILRRLARPLPVRFVPRPLR